MEKKNKTLVLSIVAIATLLIVVVGATYAFFVAQGGGSANTNVNVQTNTTDNLSFEVGEAINITANQDNFAQGLGNQAGSTTASATLTANNATNSATANYYLYLDITNNDFEYTVDTNTPELILTIIDPDGTELTNLSGYKYVEVGDVSGFDITTVSDIIKIAENYEITSTGTETQTWNITVTFVNLDTDQVENTGKTFEASLIIQAEPIQTRVNFANYITDTLYTEDGVNNLYYHDGTGDYVNSDQEAGDNSYRFSGGDYQVTETATQAGLTRVYTATNTESDGVINFYCNGEKQYVGITSCLTEQEHYYTTAYNETSHYNTLEEALNQSVIDGYLTSNNIKNFVCFDPGASDSSCDVDNLYRIIGVFDGQVKLIKYDYADTAMLGTDGDYAQTLTSTFVSGKRNEQAILYRYYWNYSSGENSTNDWSTSRLNTVNLNTNYWNYLTAVWQSKIANTTWQVGGNTLVNIRNVAVKEAYENEIVNPAEDITYQDEIGLMYVSDYMYAVDPSGWQNVGYDSSDTSNDYCGIKGNNWIYMGDAEWTITRYSDTTDYAFGASTIGAMGYTTVDVGNYAIRPVFYLNSDVQIYEGHAGTASDPYRIII